MSTTPDPATEPAPVRRRLSAKWLAVGGAGTLGVLLVVAAIWALWPSPPPKARKAQAPRAPTGALAANAVSAASAASAALPRTAEAAADDAGAADDAARHLAQAASAAAAAGPGAQRGAIDSAPADAVDPAVATQAAAAARAEPPLATLQRRLGQILGPRSQLEATPDGSLRVTMRSPGLAPVAHAEAAPAVPVKAPAAAGDAPAAAWAYEGRGGPPSWGRLKPEYRLCGSGSRQSPIDIRDGVALDLEPLQFDYRPGGVTIVDSGRTVQVKAAPGQWLDAGGRRFELQQLQFHRPSEERINGRRYDMGVHLVHRDAEGRTAIVAVLLERGEAQPLLNTLWRHLPLEKGDEVAVRAPIDLAQLLPADRRYYTYMGSLTAPPCTEGVLWLVLQQPVPVSAEQIDVFARLYPMNARPVQQLAGRLIKQSQ